MAKLDKKAVGNRIKQIRKQLNLTQAAMGKKLGLKQATVTRYEKGRVPKGEYLLKIADMGKTTVDWLLTGKKSLR